MFIHVHLFTITHALGMCPLEAIVDLIYFLQGQESTNVVHEKGFNFDDARLMRGAWRNEPNPDLCKVEISTVGTGVDFCLIILNKCNYKSIMLALQVQGVFVPSFFFFPNLPLVGEPQLWLR